MGEKSRGLTLLIPMIVLYGFFVLGGMMNIVIESLGYIPNLGFLDANLDAYRTILIEPSYMVSVLYSIGIGLFGTILSISIGVIIAFWLTRASRIKIKKIVRSVLNIGLILPYLYMIFLVVLSFSKSGILSRWLYNLGFIEGTQNMASLVYGDFSIGIVITFVLKGIPFVTFMALNVMDNINDNYKDVAVTLGCSEWQLFRRLYLPLSCDVVVWSAAVLFAYQIGAFEVPYLLGNLKLRTLSAKLYSSYVHPDISYIPETMALTVLLLLIGTCSIIVMSYGLKTFIRWWQV